MDNKNRFFARWKGKGFYLALGVCVLAAVVSSALAVNSMIGRLELQGAQSGTGARSGAGNGVSEPWEQTEEANKSVSRVPVLPGSSSSRRSGAPSSGSSSAPLPAPGASAASQPAQESSFSLPVAGKVSAAYSGDELVYNGTLADWRTHNGIDIAAEAGAPVTAALAGRVQSVSEDSLWGGVAEVESDGVTLRYCGLDGLPALAAGDAVAAGQQLGTLAGVPAEKDTGTHLHLEALRGGAYLDPAQLTR